MSRHADVQIPWDTDHLTWWACDHPERPSDNHTVYNEECEFCLIKLRADVRRDPEVREAIVQHLMDDGPLHNCMVPADILDP